jgi:hypothetical protein
MNHLGIRCNVLGGKGSITVIIVLDTGEVFRHNFKSPSIFSFSKNSGEILNWHRENIISLISQFNIQAISIKKTETTDGRISKSAIFKLYLEGVMLSLAGTLGIYNRHFYKNDIKNLLDDNQIFEKSIEEIAALHNKTLFIGTILATEKESTKEALLSVLTLQKLISND